MPTRPPRSTTPEYGPCRLCGESFLMYVPGRRGRVADFCSVACRKLSAAIDYVEEHAASMDGRPKADDIRDRLGNCIDAGKSISVVIAVEEWSGQSTVSDDQPDAA